MALDPIATVVVCTHNRAAYIGRCLDGITIQDVDFPYEVLVVDNCSTDDTVRVAESFRDRLPLRITHEPKLGLSEARNRGFREARSKIIIYIDDDAVALPGWLREIVRCFQVIQPRPASVGGRILLDWNGPALPWVAERYFGIFGYVDLSPTLLRLDDGAEPVGLFTGGNIAFDRDTLESFGGFSPKLGYKGTSLLGGEETLLLHQLIEQKRGVYYTPDAIVRHIVLPERRVRSYYAKRLIAQGQANIAIQAEAGRLDASQIPALFVRELAGLVRASIRTGAYSFRLKFRDAEFEGWEGVKRLGRLMMLVERTVEPLHARRSR